MGAVAANATTAHHQTGYVEVCKWRADHYVSGSFDYTMTATNFSKTFSLRVGECTDAIQVPAGDVTITEAPQAPYFVKSIGVQPSGRVVSRDLAAGSVTVSVPAGDQSSETLVGFRNGTTTSQIKICKTLAPNSAELTGKVFAFTVYDASGQHVDHLAATAPGTTVCTLDKSHLPVGSEVTIVEKSVPNVEVVGVSVEPASQDAGSGGSTARLVVGSGVVTIATFTNQADGTIEVCKIAADVETATQTFQFSINGAAAISVPANECSTPITVPAGTATVAESGPGNFHLVSVTAKGPDGSSRLVSGPTDNPATVQVPYGGVRNETVAEFTNAVNTGEFKICKESPEPTLQNTAFDFTYSYTLPGAAEATTGSASLEPGQCSLLSGDIPVVDPGGRPIPVYITEAATPSVEVSNVTVDNGKLVTADYSAGTATIYVKRGFTTVTYTNVRTPVGGNRGAF